MTTDNTTTTNTDTVINSDSAPTGAVADPALGDPRPLLRRAFAQCRRLLADLDDAEFALPTPCAGWDVGELVDHLLGALHRVGVVFEGQPFHTSPTFAVRSAWRPDWDAGVARAEAAIADDATLTATVTVPWGPTPGAVALAVYVGEFTVHAWDLATAIGRADELDPALAEAALAAYHIVLPAEPRGGDFIPFGAVVEVGADAGPYERVVAWTGRDPAVAAA